MSVSISNYWVVYELGLQINANVLLFTTDGFIYYGNLQGICNCSTATLCPPICASTDNRCVEILTPGGELQLVACASIDLSTVVAIGVCILHDPIYHPWPCSVPQSRETVEPRERHNITDQLECMINDKVKVTTLGGFQFVGIMYYVGFELVIMIVENINCPGVITPISANDVRSVVINLKAITEITALS